MEYIVCHNSIGRPMVDNNVHKRHRLTRPELLRPFPPQPFLLILFFQHSTNQQQPLSHGLCPDIVEGLDALITFNLCDGQA